MCAVQKKKKNTISKVVSHRCRIILETGFRFDLISVVRSVPPTFHVFHACPDLICILERAQYATYRTCFSTAPMSCSRTRYSLSLNNLLLTCRGNPLANPVQRSTGLFKVSDPVCPRRTANVDYRAVCRPPYSYLVSTTFIIAHDIGRRLQRT